MVLGKLESHIQKNETRLLFTKSYTKINSKWIKDMRPETRKYIEENRGTKLMDLDLREDFMNLTSKAKEIKQK